MPQTEKAWRYFNSTLIYKLMCLADPEMWAQTQSTIQEG